MHINVQNFIFSFRFRSLAVHVLSIGVWIDVMGLQRLLRRVDQDENKCEADEREVKNKENSRAAKELELAKKELE